MFFEKGQKQPKKVKNAIASFATNQQPTATKTCTEIRSQSAHHVCSRFSRCVCNFVTIANRRNKRGNDFGSICTQKLRK
jgi:hypothetical protein